ncbi:Rab family GTPase [Roseivirga misakiensis]|uniref:GTP-binding protein n=1 Tax=Roseivirga misakiensis TaxID=1563681 RepID=A0A1E5T6I2_9BACT|nr:Rab family GTPase [Roseivirga misakiensis]OEK06956.1 GTP-binding protein [Roseivirga misakiensis]
MSVSKKVILIGHFGVGKSSLVKRFVHQKFSEDYITTIGVKIDKKVVNVKGLSVNMIIWDIAGEDSQQKVPASYRLGAHGALYVFDVSRPSTYEKLTEELAFLNDIIPDIPIQILANKCDLLSEEELKEVLEKVANPQVFQTSAKTGDHVEEAFELLAKSMVS